MKRIVKILLLIWLVPSLVSCNISPKKTVEHELSIAVPANEYAINNMKKESVIIEERKDRIYDDLPVDDGPVVQIDEKQFLTKIANIKSKIDEYKDKIIVVEGMYATYSSWDDSFQGSLVYRNGPNDFNNDIWGGFFLDNLKEQDVQIDDWIQVIGTPYIYSTEDSEGNEYDYLYLNVQELHILTEKERGLELVNN